MSIAKDHPCINSKDNPLLEYQDGRLIGKNPLSTEVNLIRAAGHENIPLGKIIRKNCLSCCGFQQSEVRKCAATDCALWPYRMGKNPFLSDKRKALPSSFANKEG